MKGGTKGLKPTPKAVGGVAGASGRQGRGVSGGAQQMNQGDSDRFQAQKNQETGQQYLNQFFKQKKHSNYMKANAAGAYPQNRGGKFSQVDSPKDGSIERARQDDIVQQESQISQMNRLLLNPITIDNQGQDPSQPQEVNVPIGRASNVSNLSKAVGATNANQLYILQQIEQRDSG